jgi:hypothetical protein
MLSFGWMLDMMRLHLEIVKANIAFLSEPIALHPSKVA